MVQECDYCGSAKFIVSFPVSQRQIRGRVVWQNRSYLFNNQINCVSKYVYINCYLFVRVCGGTRGVISYIC